MARAAFDEVHKAESKADRIEESLIEKLFEDPENNIRTTVFRDFIKSVVKISDRAENVGDRIRLIVAKRSA